MSKIEQALKKARTAEPVRSPRPRPQQRTQQRRHAETRTHPPLRGEMVGLSSAEQIAHMQEPGLRSHRDLVARRIIDAESSGSPVGDAFRHLRTELLKKTAGRNCVLLVSSVGTAGGGSFVAQNLGSAIALDPGKTALLVDCHLRRPRSSELAVSPSSQAGLTDFLSGETRRVEEIIHPIGIPRVRVIPVGTRRNTAAEYFTAPRLEQLLDELRNRYPERFVIVDAPPITEAADSRILAELCDYTMLVVPYGRATPAQLRSAMEAVPDERFVGCVFNDEPKIPFRRKH